MLNIIPKPYFVRELPGFCCAAEPTYIKDESLSCEEYKISVSESEIKIFYSSDCGKFYAGKTLLQLSVCGKIPCCEIYDKPKFEYRGFLLDSVRHIQSTEEIKKLIDLAALFKLNVFHWHLSDDQGFRIEIKSFPKLNEIASFRDGDRFGSMHHDNKYGGYYTKSEIEEIVEYCHERHIKVIPEIDMPGHMSAVISAYPELSCEGKQIPVQCTNGIFPEILCGGKSVVREFLQKLLDEIIPLFPDEYFHIGGDEAPKTKWKNCPDCQNKIKSLGLKNENELQAVFMNDIAAYLKTKGKKCIIWNDGLDNKLTNKEITVQNWMDKRRNCPQFANDGGKLICSDFFYNYLDYVYAQTPLKKTYSYRIYPKGVPENSKSVYGVEGTVWTEFIDNFERLSYMAFPRLCAVSEQGWSYARGEYKDFKSRLAALYPVFEKYGVKPASLSDADSRSPEKIFNMIKFLLNIQKH